MLGWSCTEVVATVFASLDLGDVTSMAEARALVALGERRWARKQGNVLALVAPDYKLQMWESFLVERSPGHFIE